MLQHLSLEIVIELRIEMVEDGYFWNQIYAKKTWYDI